MVEISIHFIQNARIRGESDDLKFPSCIKEILHKHTVGSPCPHCGYGEYTVEAYSLINGSFAYCQQWCGCLTYEEETDGDQGFEVVVARTWNQLVNLMSKKEKNLLFKKKA
jgi:hypothetical protein